MASLIFAPRQPSFHHQCEMPRCSILAPHEKGEYREGKRQPWPPKRRKHTGRAINQKQAKNQPSKQPTVPYSIVLN
jgi:hypothetical protein